jgi:DNA-binding NtrC family response regulator
LLETLSRLPLHDSVAEWEKFRILRALEESNNNKAEGARRLGVHRRLLYEKMKKLGIDVAEEVQESDEAGEHS